MTSLSKSDNDVTHNLHFFVKEVVKGIRLSNFLQGFLHLKQGNPYFADIDLLKFVKSILSYCFSAGKILSSHLKKAEGVLLPGVLLDIVGEYVGADFIDGREITILSELKGFSLYICMLSLHNSLWDRTLANPFIGMLKACQRVGILPSHWTFFSIKLACTWEKMNGQELNWSGYKRDWDDLFRVKFTPDDLRVMILANTDPSQQGISDIDKLSRGRPSSLHLDLSLVIDGKVISLVTPPPSHDPLSIRLLCLYDFNVSDQTVAQMREAGVRLGRRTYDTSQILRIVPYKKN